MLNGNAAHAAIMRRVASFAEPYRHVIIDNFFAPDVALQLEAEFPPYHDPAWYCYNSAIEKKKTLNYWHMFPPTTYRVMQELCELTPEGAVADFGLHGGGWHIHANGGNLNPHLDYTAHPKLGKLRQWSLIVYLASDYREEYGGHLGFWKGGDLAQTIAPQFNRAVLFSTPGAVHGLATPFLCPEGVYRKSLAVYYVKGEGAGLTRARFFPREGQGEDVDALIKRRSEGQYS